MFDNEGITHALVTAQVTLGATILPIIAAALAATPSRGSSSQAGT